MGSRQIVLVSTAGISVLNAGIFWQEAKTKRPFSQCMSFRFYSLVRFKVLEKDNTQLAMIYNFSGLIHNIMLLHYKKKFSTYPCSLDKN
jgi:hypothetical protein